MSPPMADLLVAFATHALELFHDGADEAWAWGGADTLRVGSAPFAERLAADFYGSTGKVASKTALSAAVNTLRGIARWDGPEVPVDLRIAGHEGAVVVDLVDEARRVVVISPAGWKVTSDSPVRFHRPAGMLPLPVPVRAGSLEDLEALLPVSGDDLVLVLGWVLGCFNPEGPKPILDLSGTQGSGKSLLAQMLRSLVDPNASPLQTLPTDVRNLAIGCAHHAVPTFDNISLVSAELSDALCRVATGAAFEIRKLYTDDDVATFRARRPVLLTGIPEVARQADLADRTISVVLPQMKADERRSEVEILAAFQALRPQVLGVLFDAASCALANMHEVTIEEAPRMLDFARWVEAGAPALGWEPGRFLRAYAANRTEASAGVIEATVIGRFLPELASQGFSGSATQMLARLGEIAGADATRSRGWPKTPAGLSGILRRLAPGLANQEIEVGFGKIGGRRIISVQDQGTSSGEVLAFERPASSNGRVDEVTDSLRAIGVDDTCDPRRAAGLALQKATGNASLAAEALNALGITSPGGSDWTPESLRGAI